MNSNQPPDSAASFKRKKTGAFPTPIEVETTPATDGQGDETSRLPAGAMAQLVVDVRRGAVDREAAGAIARPLGELAKAFAMQAEVLKSVHDAQARLQEAIQNDRRSEVMLNSTNALNETFRGVRSVQQGLIDRLGRADESSARRRWLLGAALLVALAAVVWTVQSLLTRDNRGDSELSGRLDRLEADVLPQTQSLIDQVTADKRDAETRLRETQEDRLRQEQELARWRAQSELGGREKEAALDEVERLRLGAIKQGEATDLLNGKLRVLEIENADLLRKREDLEATIGRLNDQIVANMAALAAARPRSDKQGMDTPIVAANAGDAAASEKAVSVAGTDAPSAPADRTVEPRESGAATADPRPVPPAATDAVINRLNLLLSRHRSQNVFAISSAGTIGKDRLEDVVLTEAAPGKGVIKTVVARSLRFVLSPQADMVELNFEDGTVKQEGATARPTPFYNDKYRMTVYCTNGTEWLAQNEPYIVVM